MCWSGGNQRTDAALSPVGFVEASFDTGHQGLKLCCCFEESESDGNGPSCAPACLPRKIYHPPYLFTANSHITTLHTHFLPRLSLLSHSLYLSLSAPHPPSSLLPRCLSTSAHIHKTGFVLADGCSFWIIKKCSTPEGFITPIYIFPCRGAT